MNFWLNFPFRAGIFTLGVWFLSLASVGAIQIDFSADQGYSPTAGPAGLGDLEGQPSSGTTWNAGSGQRGWETLRIVAEPSRPDGNAGQVLKSFAVPSGALPVYVFSPSAQDLGGEFDPAHSHVKFTIWIRYDGTLVPDGGVLLRPNFGAMVPGCKPGSLPLTSFEVLADGRFIFATNGTFPPGPDGVAHKRPCIAKDSNGDTLKATPGTWCKIEGVLDFEKKIYSVSINGVAQDIEGNPEIPFVSTDPMALKPDFSLRALSTGAPNFCPVSVAEVTLALDGAGKTGP